MSVATSQLENLKDVESLRHIARTFLMEWRRAHGRPGDSSRATLGEHGLTVTISNALTAAEQRLLRKTAGRQLVQRYVGHLMDQAYPRLADSIERQLHCQVSHWMVDVEREEGDIHFNVSLQNMPSPLVALAA